VCRLPNFIVVDNDRITVNEGHTSKQFDGIKAVLAESCCTYQQLLEQEALIGYIVRQANKKLDELRKTVPDAAGLIVAASVAHAHQIARLLRKTLNEHAVVATYCEEDAAHIIRQFKTDTQKWIISVGMISEGTNIPRLHVCCHLTRVKTELYFRQVLGRILRSCGKKGETAYLYMPAEPTLTQYAERLADDIPTMDIIHFERMPKRNRRGEMTPANSTTTSDNAINLTIDADFHPRPELKISSQESLSYSTLAQSYESTINLFGKFRQEILSFHFKPALT
jgi:superfamily II DNA or RNA helicase